MHGATVVLNALLQMRLPRTGLITTQGFRDVLEIMRTNNPEMYDLSYVKPAPVIPRALRHEVRERIRHTGEVLVPLDEEDVRRAARALVELEVEAIAVCLLHAYANPEHELRVAEIVREEAPGLTVCCSSEVAPEWREFERTSTTCVNAATVPIISSYLDRLTELLASRGLSSELLVMQSNGGVMTAGAACRWPVRTVMSGPSGGVVGAMALADAIDTPNVVTIDIGGTSSDMGVIHAGRAVTVVESTVADGCPILAPMIEILSIGAGGGSIAWRDEGGALRVGPQSAGADPAPVCYRRGGVEPTVTDANVVLGRIDPEYFLGGEMELDVDGARGAIRDRVAEPLGLELESAADGVLQIVNTNMAKAMRSILIERGHDPRDFVLMAFGGGGGLHAAPVMRELNIPRAVVPANPGALSATGMLGTDYRNDRSRTMVRAMDDSLDMGDVERVCSELGRDAAGALTGEGVPADTISLHQSVDMRYEGQEYHLNIPFAGESDSAVEMLTAAFNAEHARVYGYSTPDFGVQLVGLRVTAIERTERPPTPESILGPRAGRRRGMPSGRCTSASTAGWIPPSIWSPNWVRAMCSPVRRWSRIRGRRC